MAKYNRKVNKQWKYSILENRIFAFADEQKILFHLLRMASIIRVNTIYCFVLFAFLLKKSLKDNNEFL